MIDKTLSPSQRPNLVTSPRLLAKLDRTLKNKIPLLLVSAKAGSGKTTLISDWLHWQDRSASWLSLDANDNDPRRFYA